MHQDVTLMTRDDIEAEIGHMQEHYDECARIGQGISTKEGSWMRRLRAELHARDLAPAA